MKKGQVIGQVFIYIITALIIGVVLLFGIRAIMQLMNTAEEARISTFLADFPKRLQADYDYEKVDDKAIRIPGDFSEMCFIQINLSATLCGQQSMNPPQPIIENSWKDCAQQNIFLVSKTDIRMMHVPDLRVNTPADKYLCVKSQGGVITNLIFRGRGSGVTVERK